MEVAEISSCGLNSTLRIVVSEHPHILLISSAALEIIHTHYRGPHRPCGAITHLTTNPAPVRTLSHPKALPSRIFPNMADNDPYRMMASGMPSYRFCLRLVPISVHENKTCSQSILGLDIYRHEMTASL